MAEAQQLEFEGRQVLIVMAAKALAGEIADVLGERGAKSTWVDSSQSGWERELSALQSPIDVLVQFAPSLRGVAADPSAALRRSWDAVSALKVIEEQMFNRSFGRIVYLLSKAEELDPESGTLARATHRLFHGTGRRGADVVVNRLMLGSVEGQGEPHELVAVTPVGRATSLREVAEAVAFLASPRAGFISGATLPLTGGLGLGLFPDPLNSPSP